MQQDDGRRDDFWRSILTVAKKSRPCAGLYPSERSSFEWRAKECFAVFVGIGEFRRDASELNGPRILYAVTPAHSKSGGIAV